MVKEIKIICEKNAEEHNFSGVCMVKKADEILFAKAYGYANRAFKIPNNIDTRFDTASITKIFTAAAVLQLASQNLLSLDDKITDIVNLKGTKIPKDVTIAHLLSHTSGIADDADEEAGEDYSALFVDSPNYAIKECKDFLKNFAYKDPVFKAGTNARYCNCSFVLLGLAIEKVTGMNFRDYYQKNIFDKAGMTSTGFYSMDDINANTAEGYKSIVDEDDNIIGYKKNIYCYPPKGTPDGGAYTTAEDLTKFLKSIRNHVILDEKYADMFLQPHCRFTKDDSWYEIPGLYHQYGYAFEFFMIKDQAEPLCIYKEGCNDGVSAIFCYYPGYDTTVTLLANQDCDVWSMRKEIQLLLYNSNKNLVQ